MALNVVYLRRCVGSLEYALQRLECSGDDCVEYDAFRNAAIKSFELALETSGKLLRKLLKPYFATPKAVDRLVFKDLFRYGAKHGLLSLDSVERWLVYRDNRNQMSRLMRYCCCARH